MVREIKDTGSLLDSTEPRIDSTGSDYEVKFKISSNARKKLPENFNIQDIGSIDLKEAEAIANEDILFLTENDLIEGLEDFDLIPLNEDASHQPIQDTELRIFKPNIPEVVDSPKKLNPGLKSIPVSRNDNVEPEILKGETFKDNILESDEISNLPASVLSGENSTDEVITEIQSGDFQIQKDILDSESDLDNIKSSFAKLESEDLLDESEESSYLEPSMADAGSTNIKILSREEEVELFDDGDKSVLHPSDDLYSKPTESESYFQAKPAIGKEKLPEWVYTLESSTDKTYFIDDSSVESDKRPIVLNFEERELEKITSRIFETYEIKPKILLEADIEDDKENIAYTSSGIPPAFDDLLLDYEDYEIKYRDDDLEFIHSSIIEEDYSKYLRLIDDYHSLTGDRKVTTAVELLGLTYDELDDMEDALFANEYKGINLDEVVSLIKNQSVLNYKNKGRKITCTYLLTESGSLLPEEKKSIEADISSSFALIYEEDVAQLKSHLKEIFVETKPDSVKLVEEIYDITDRVVILDDEEDMQRFVQKIPEHKRGDLARLMKYLDGMFEKLPENAVKNFADSEYFNLYVKILNDLGI